MKNRYVDAVSTQIRSTLTNMQTEITVNGVTQAADDMWQHALSMYRVHRSSVPVFGGVSVDMPNRHTQYDIELPCLLRQQAE